jgi:hypothetical protein
MTSVALTIAATPLGVSSIDAMLQKFRDGCGADARYEPRREP